MPSVPQIRNCVIWVPWFIITSIGRKVAEGLKMIGVSVVSLCPISKLGWGASKARTARRLCHFQVNFLKLSVTQSI